jgi:hypothetical protein
MRLTQQEVAQNKQHVALEMEANTSHYYQETERKNSLWKTYLHILNTRTKTVAMAATMSHIYNLI